MEYRGLGNTGLKVPVLCLGAMTFGVADEKSFMHEVGCDEKTSFSIMSHALEKGVNFIDTADVYGQDGLSERIVGKWMKEHKTRDRSVLATKFRFRMGEGPNTSGASRYRIVRTVEESLKRLPGVRDAAVVGVPDPRFGERICAVVELADGAAAPTLADVQGHVRSQLADYKAPELSIFVLYPPTRHLSAKVRVFIDFLVERFAGRPYWDLVE